MDQKIGGGPVIKLRTGTEKGIIFITARKSSEKGFFCRSIWRIMSHIGCKLHLSSDLRRFPMVRCRRSLHTITLCVDLEFHCVYRFRTFLLFYPENLS